MEPNSKDSDQLEKSGRMWYHSESQRTVENPQAFSLEHEEQEENMITQRVTNHLSLLLRTKPVSGRREKPERASPAPGGSVEKEVFDPVMGRPSLLKEDSRVPSARSSSRG